MDELPETFVLGDEKNYKGFFNKPLSEDLSYRCFVLASLEDGDTVRTLKEKKTVSELALLDYWHSRDCRSFSFHLPVHISIYIIFCCTPVWTSERKGRVIECCFCVKCVSNVQRNEDIWVFLFCPMLWLLLSATFTCNGSLELVKCVITHPV